MPSTIASTTPARMPINGFSLNSRPARYPIATEYAAHVIAAPSESRTKRRRGNPTAPAVRFTATRPTGM